MNPFDSFKFKVGDTVTHKVMKYAGLGGRIPSRFVVLARCLEEDGNRRVYLLTGSTEKMGYSDNCSLYEEELESYPDAKMDLAVDMVLSDFLKKGNTNE